MKTIDHYEIRIDDHKGMKATEVYELHSDYQSRAETLDMQGIEYYACIVYEDNTVEDDHEIGWTPWQVSHLKAQVAKLREEEN